jgi:GNAT superfamily N-acetyltransferase
VKEDVNDPAVSGETVASAVPPGYPAELEGSVVLADGTAVAVRPIVPGDGPALAEFHLGLSDLSVYLRFFGAHPRLSPAEVERFTCVDYQDRLALVATVNGRLSGVGRYDRGDGDAAEVAFVVADQYQHRGIGSVLLERLARAARQRGITTFYAQTMAENRSMLDVFVHSGYPVSTKSDHQLVEVTFPIAERSGTLAAQEGGPPC